MRGAVSTRATAAKSTNAMPSAQQVETMLSDPARRARFPHRLKHADISFPPGRESAEFYHLACGETSSDNILAKRARFDAEGISGGHTSLTRNDSSSLPRRIPNRIWTRDF